VALVNATIMNGGTLMKIIAVIGSVTGGRVVCVGPGAVVQAEREIVIVPMTAIIFMSVPPFIIVAFTKATRFATAKTLA
ncbi:MAG: hypothetical protein AAFO77_05670, partial [Pseudomonadota bacterium]